MIRVVKGSFYHVADVWKLRLAAHEDSVKREPSFEMPDDTAIAQKIYQTHGWLLGEGGELVLLAVNGEQPVGLMVIRPGQWVGHGHSTWQILELFVVESERGGVAALKLLLTAKRIFTVAGADRIQAVVHDDNAHMLKFAARAGAQRVGAIWEGGLHGRQPRSSVGEEVHRQSRQQSPVGAESS